MSGELPPGWVEATVGELCDINPKHASDTDRSIPVSFVPMPAVSDVHGIILPHSSRPLSEVWTGYTHFQDNDVIFAKITPCMENGKAAVAKGLANGMACGSTEFYVMRSKGAVNPTYLHSFLRQQSYRNEAEANMTGAVGQRRVPRSFLEETTIPLPPLPEQHRIVERIEALLAKGAKAKAALDTLPALLDRYRQSLLAAAFRGDLTADWRRQNAEVTSVEDTLKCTPAPQQPRGGREATTSVIPGRAALSVNHPGTELPKGWAWVPLLRIARQETGHTPTRAKPEYWDGDIPWIGIRDAGAHHGKLIADTLQHVTAEGLANSSARLLPAGTVCLSRTASVGYVTIMGRDMATSQDFATWTCTSALLPEYLMYALMAEGEDIRKFGEGTTHTTIYFPEIRALHIGLAPLAEQSEIIRLVKAGLWRVDQLASTIAAVNSQHTTLTQSILAKAFRGELVPQDPADEPASVLLDRIRSERVEKPERGRRVGTRKN